MSILEQLNKKDPSVMNEQSQENPIILIVDDTPSNLQFLFTYLENKNYRVFVAQHGKQALTISESIRPDLILLDILMPGLSGFEVCQKLKAKQETEDIPIIFLTALSEPSNKVQGFESGGVDYVTKPIAPNELLARIQTHLTLRKTQRLLKERNEKLSQLSEELIVANQKLEELSFSDPLTKTFNRRHFEVQLNQDWNRLVRYPDSLSIILCDVDYFKVYNDTYGHPAGDRCLQQVAGAIVSTVKRPSDWVARYGGEEFIVVLPRTPIRGALKIAQAIRSQVKALEIPHESSSACSVVTLSLGVASVVPTHKTSPLLVVKAADTALYQAKTQGRDRVEVYFDELSEERFNGSCDLQGFNTLSQALAENRFCFYVQRIEPLQAKESNRKFEILLRLLDRDGKRVSASFDFLKNAACDSLLPKIDRWTVEHLLSYLSNSDLKHWEEGALSVNLSGTVLADSQFIEFLRQQLERYNLPPQLFCFEIPEAAAIAHLTQATQFAQSLKLLGCTVALDDFGGNLCSLQSLKEFPVDFWKIDGDLSKNIETDIVKKSIVEAIEKVARTIGIQTISKSVETETSFEALQKLGVNYAQGFYISQPQRLISN
ncbi:diguanylate cyclase [Lusitaniella coriacea]|uniref:diguanylate cyclase n=1 Tax=Lusitaniella coriacea TaxID=1983105 RepID=UPI003CEB2FA6